MVAVRVNIKKMSLKQLQDLLIERGPEVYPDVIRALESDPRGGAQKLVRLCQSKLDEVDRERERIGRMFSYERQVWAMGYKFVAGLDEVGRGPLAGPVVAAAVVLPGELMLPGLDDVKRLSPKRRQELYELIKREAIAIGIGMVHPSGIDEANVTMATYKAMVKAVAQLHIAPDYLLIDALHLPNVTQPQAPIVDGEGQSCSIAAASIVAKVVRDEQMIEMDRLYPVYGFANHKGYGTQEHRDALERFGPCPIHRKNYQADREIISLAQGALFADD
jgi:ribonuclease HII